jgi:hypothetical protein
VHVQMTSKTSGSVARCAKPATYRAEGPVRRADAIALQRAAGNAAVAAMLGRRVGSTTELPTVLRCGTAHPDCTCAAAEKADTLQRDNPVPNAADAGDPFVPNLGMLRFTDRIFPDQSLPTVCPNCHRDRPTVPAIPRRVDQDATEPRLVGWGTESERMVQVDGTLRLLQVEPGATDKIVEDYGAGLIKRITSSNEFAGPDAARQQGAEIIRRRWPDIRPPVRAKLSTWYQTELLTAISMTPKLARPLLDPEQVRQARTTHHGGRASLGRWGAEAVPGQKYGIFEIDDIGLGMLWFHLSGRPHWLYVINTGDFISHDPLVAAVADQVFDKTKWILQVTPMLLKIGAFGLGFSGSIALVITGIVLDELAEEMKRGADGKPGRSPMEILGSAGIQLLVDRIAHGLFGGAPGRAVASAGRAASKIERIVEKALPAIRRELVAAERPLVKEALEQGTARKVTDAALKREGYAVEVAVEAAGQQHIYRLGKNNRWCRFSNPICDLDLGNDAAKLAGSSSSFTKSQLVSTRERIATVTQEIEFLMSTYQRMKTLGRMDLSVLSKQEVELLAQLADKPAANVTLAELRGLNRELGLAGEVAKGVEGEAALIMQLYREGRPLYEIMRAASPSSAARSAVNKTAAGRDAVTGLRPRTGSLDVDHVVPLNEIVRMNGFDKLRPPRQLEVVNDLRNLRAIDSAANASRGDRAWSLWGQSAIHYDIAGINRMRALEDELRRYLAERIRTLSRP